MGLITGLVLTLWVGIGSLIYPASVDKTNPLPLTDEGCNNTIGQNYTTMVPWTSVEPSTAEYVLQNAIRISKEYVCHTIIIDIFISR